MKDYEQMELDVTLSGDRDLKDNLQNVAKFALEQFKNYEHPEVVKNRHEGYGIAAEGYSAMQRKIKDAKTDMDSMLRMLSSLDGSMMNIVGSLYNSSVEIAVEAIKLAAQSQRVLNDLYYGENGKTPIEEYIEETEDGFEEVEESSSEEVEESEEL